MSERAGARAVTLTPLDIDLARRWVRAAESAAERAPGAAARDRARVEIERALRAGGARLLPLAARLEKRAKRASPATAKSARRLAALLRLRAGQGGAPAATLCGALDVLREAIGYERATAFVYEAATEQLVPVAVAGGHVDLIPEIAFDHGAGFSSWVAKTRRPVLLSAFREEPDMPLTDRPASFLSVPVQENGSFVGVLNFAHRRPGAFVAADRDVAVLAGRIVAAGVAPARTATAPAEHDTTPPSRENGTAR